MSIFNRFTGNKQQTPARQYAQILAENLMLKKELEKAQSIEAARKVQADFDKEVAMAAKDLPTGQPIPASKPASNKSVADTLADIEKGRDSFSKQLLDRNKDIKDSRSSDGSKIQARIDKMKELDIKAVESQKAYNSNGRSFSVSANTTIYATGCDNGAVFQAIGRENDKRIQNRQEPFLTYAEWMSAADQPKSPITQSRYIFIDRTNDINDRLSKATPMYIVSGKYYILRDNGVTYFLNNTVLPSDRKVVILGKQGLQANSDGNGDTVIWNDRIYPVINLTDAEHNDIVKNKPSLENLFQVYVQTFNTDNIEMDFTKATNIW